MTWHQCGSELAQDWSDFCFKMLVLTSQRSSSSTKLTLFCGQRKAYDSISHNEQRAELLAQMDGARGDNERILFVGATNLPWALDPAFLRREFSKQLYIPLPEYDTRVKLLSLQLQQIQFQDKNHHNETIQGLAKRTDGFSGSDIKKLIQEVLQMGLRNVEAATHFRLVRTTCIWPESSIKVNFSFYRPRINSFTPAKKAIRGR